MLATFFNLCLLLQPMSVGEIKISSLQYAVASLSCRDIDYNYSVIEVASIAQLDRALVFGTSGWEFESLWTHFSFNFASRILLTLI